MNTPLAYLNGRFLPFAEAALPLHDAGFVSGATVVDNARTFRHKLFRWPDHLARLRRDCASCYVTLDATDEQLTATAEELIAHNAKLLPLGGELQLVTFATPGTLGFYTGEANSSATLGMATYPLPFARYRSFFTAGVTLAVVGSHGVVNETILPPTAKHRSRMLWHIADQRAKVIAPGALGIPLDGLNGAFTETSIGNFLAVVDGVVTTPPRETILDGISLRVTEELCAQLSLPFAEARLELARAAEFSEVLLTGTAFCIAGVRELWATPDRKVGGCSAWPGPVLTKLLAAWSDLVGVDIVKQFTETQG